jgi:hypothetical protein
MVSLKEEIFEDPMALGLEFDKIFIKIEANEALTDSANSLG